MSDEIRVPNFPPPLGRVWGVLIYPGGRCEITPCAPEELELGIEDAAHRLRLGIAVRVLPEHFVATVTAWTDSEEQALARIAQGRREVIQSALASFGKIPFGGYTCTG